MKIRIATEVIKNILISSMILYISFNEIKNKIKEKKNDDKTELDNDDDLFKNTDFE